ncbi:slipin family protein [Streptomyces yerevanensis]|uniref:slipin family protein n=1 Tax=Streptomyces yerevanensis TaxID=66378 RepID=UPI0006919F90|nr:slipin family protein [Streptomyces yerevanensis]
MIEELVTAGLTLGSVGAVYVAAAARVVKQYERGVVLRLGKLRSEVRGPGFTMIVPFVDRLQKVNMQIVTMPVPGQEGITRDNVTVRVDAVVYFKVVSAADAVIRVEDYRFAVAQMAQTSLRSIIGKSDLDDLLSNREKLNQGLELMIDSPAVEWGVTIDRVEIKDVSLPETMKRSMARQAEADRERRARIINADAELQASKKLAEAAKEMADTPSALQLRLLQTVVAVAAEKNSTLVLPFPVELLRFLERAQQPAPPSQEQQPSLPSPELFSQLQKLLSQPQQQLARAKEPPAESTAESSPAPSYESASEPKRSAPSMAEQSLREQLPPVPEPFDPDSGGSKSGQV